MGPGQRPAGLTEAQACDCRCPELAVGQHQEHSWHVLVEGAIRLRAEGRKGARMAEAGHVEGGAADASANRSRARRLVQIVLAVLVAFVVPVLLLDAFVGQYAANAMVLGVAGRRPGLQDRRNPPDAVPGASDRASGGAWGVHRL